MNVAEAVMTGIVGWLLAKAFRKADEPAAAPAHRGPAEPHPAAPRSPITIPWPRGATSVPTSTPKPALATPDDARKATAQTSAPYGPLPHVLVPSGRQPGGETIRRQFFKQTGRAVRQNEEAAVISRERLPFDRTYWRPKRKLGGAIVARAKQLLGQWRPGGVFYDGPRTFAGRVQFRMVKHSGKRAVEAWEPAPPFTA